MILKTPKRILPIIVFAQFCGTSLWFSGNAVMNDLISEYDIAQEAIAYLTSAVQLGFIFGTLSFGLLSVVDRFSPSKVFLFSAFAASISNLGLFASGNTVYTLLLCRFATGFFLAGIYPVGIKIATDYYEKGLGKSLGYLVGALVLGTALPHLLSDVLREVSWHSIIIYTSIIASVGGLLLYFFVPDGPFRAKGVSIDFKQFSRTFIDSKLKRSALGYFAHMWELYAFWAVVPIILTSYNSITNSPINISLFTFVIIGVGAIGCVLAGYISEKVGATKVAKTALLLSMVCCFASPLLFEFTSSAFLIAFLCFWGIVVVADSPLFSTLVARNANSFKKGSTIILVTCIGFAISILGIQAVFYFIALIGLQYALPILGIGPLSFFIYRYVRRSN